MRPLVILLALLWTLLCSSCNSSAADPAPSGPNTSPPPTSGTVSFLALGDSYTIGQNVPVEDRWPAQLARLNPPSGLQAPDIIARTGWTTADLQRGIAAANRQKTYDLVSLMIGVNNQYQGLPLPAYRTEFRQLLQTAIRLAGHRPGRVVVLSIPDWGLSPTGQRSDPARISQQIDEFNAVAQEESRAVGVAFVNVTDLTRTAANDPAQFAPDGLHYSGIQMRQWAERVQPVVQALLQ